MTKGRIAIVGAGGHAKVVISTAIAAGYAIAGVFDDRQDLWGREVLGHRVDGPAEAASGCSCDAAIVAIGQNADRRAVAGRLQIPWATLIHPSAVVCSPDLLAEGTVVFAHAVLQPDSRVGCHVIINTGASVDHDCDIGDYVHIAPGVRLGGNVRLGSDCLMGIGAIAAPGTSIGALSVVGAGSVVITDVPSSTTVAGVPARPLKR